MQREEKEIECESHLSFRVCLQSHLAMFIITYHLQLLLHIYLHLERGNGELVSLRKDIYLHLEKGNG